MLHKKIASLIFGLFVIINSASSQDSIQTFIAQKGDGIISVLRREGLDIKTFYQKFLDLNKDQISNGSLLKLGETYIIPNGENSYSNMGRIISLSENTENPIFDTRFKSLSKKDSTLKNTVYYLLFDKFNSDDLQLLKAPIGVRKDLAMGMAKELLEQGARVFLFEYDKQKNQNLGDYVAAINQRYLKYREKYQRLLVLDVDNGDFGKTIMVSVAHHENSEDGKRFANSIERIFKEKNIKLKPANEKGGFFVDKTNLYLANNVLPTMSYIKVEDINKKTTNKRIADSDKNKFVDVLTTGIQIDYSNLIIEDEN
tara:strand:+ start:8323 stop:9261 length:939 start_codon:yes stop_codon:yes gene_type:complete